MKLTMNQTTGLLLLLLGCFAIGNAAAQPTPPGTGGTNSGGSGPVFSSPAYGTNFWVEALPPGANLYNSNPNALTLLLHGTLPEVTYQLWSATNLQGANIPWTLEQTVLGSAATNFTAATTLRGGEPVKYFKALAFSLDSAEVGLPDWWQLKYFGYVGVDPYGDPAGDGWSNLRKYQLGMNPNVFYPPPAPTGLTAAVNSNGLLTLSWNPASNLPSTGAGAVTGYTVAFPYGLSNVTLSASQTNYTADVSRFAFFGNPPYGQLTETVQINYANGASAAASLPQVIPGQRNVPTTFARGSNGLLNLVALTPIPQDIAALRVYWATDIFETPIVFDVPVSKFTNNVYVVPDAQIPKTWVLVGTRTIDNKGILYGPTGYWWQQLNNLPFYDGSVQTEQNISFLLQAASSVTAHSYGITFPGVGNDFYYPFGIAANYVSAGFYDITDGGGAYWGRDYPFTYLDEAKPFNDNYYLRNFMAASGDINADGSFKSDMLGDGYDYDAPFTNSVLANGYDLRFALGNFENNGAAPPPLLPDNQYFFYEDDLSEVGITYNFGTGQYELQGNTSNYFGLRIDSALAAYATNGVLTLQTLAANHPVPGNAVSIFPQAVPPEFQTAGYYFGRPGIDPLPGNAAFSTTNQTPPMVVGFGPSISITGWAKQRLLNGYATACAYPQQYFAAAYAADANGNITTNSAGILSEYGEFFPMQAGAAYLATKPDAATGTVGTNAMQVMKLILDVNHDGALDPSFLGPDNTWPDHPCVLWANNNFDRLAPDTQDGTNYEDDVLTANCPYINTPTPDGDYRDVAGNRVIPSMRDLQDFTRLWVAGLTSNLVARLPAGSTVTLSWADIWDGAEFSQAGNPTIDLFTAADADGGMGYLTNSTIATKQTNINLCPYLGRLGPGQSIQLNAATFSNSWAGNHFIWCGVTNGSGQLNLTIADANGNVLAQTTAYLQIVDIKQMYERWTVGDLPGNAPAATPYLAENDLPQGATAPFQYGPAADTNTAYILYVHGWNMESWEKDRFAESAFKRLYWQGYQGRFGSFRWPTGSGFKGISTLATNPTEKDNFDLSEYQAWQSARGLLNKLTGLNAQYPGHVYLLAHSMGNVVAGEALRLSGNTHVVNTYVASQGAVSAHTYDTNIVNYSFYYPPFSYSADTPNIYGNWFLGNNGGGAGQVVNFYNTNDYALQRSVWQLDQLFKPDQQVHSGGFVWSYIYNGATNDPSPWNYFSKSDPLGANIISFDIVNVLTNRYEVMAYAAQSWTTAFGATPGVHHVAANIDLGRITNPRIWPPDTDPRFQNNPYSEHFYHSAEFRGDYWQQQGYWSELLSSEAFNLK